MASAVSEHLQAWRYAMLERRLLDDQGEVVIDIVTKHWVVYIKAVAVILLSVPLVLASLVVPSLAVAGVFFALAVAATVVGTIMATEVFLDVFVITTFRVFRSSGVFSTRRATMPVARILDLTVEQPMLGRMLGYGHFVFESAAQSQGLRDIRYISRPVERERKVQQLIHGAGLAK